MRGVLSPWNDLFAHSSRDKNAPSVGELLLFVYQISGYILFYTLRGNFQWSVTEYFVHTHQITVILKFNARYSFEDKIQK